MWHGDTFAKCIFTRKKWNAKFAKTFHCQNNPVYDTFKKVIKQGQKTFEKNERTKTQKKVTETRVGLTKAYSTQCNRVVSSNYTM